jgi:thiol-disulfide isomerase/thioredoxin
MRHSILFILCVLILASCIEIAEPFSKLPPGVWRAELELDEGVYLPFNFEVIYDASDNLAIKLINGEERIEVGGVAFGKNKKLLDTIRMEFTLMDSYIRGIYKENVIEGYWTVNYKENYRVPFVAYFGQRHRFTQTTKAPVMDVAGKWKTTFEVETPDAYPAIGEFKTDRNKVTGTFLTETGDYRYLDGEVQGDQFMLSCFDGSHAFLFTADITESESMIGKFYSGSHYQTNWIANRDESAELANPYEMSKAISESEVINFSLPSTDGSIITLDDDRYKGKPKLIKIMGTWCPNCLDESKFLLEYKKENPEVDIPIIAIAFERYRDEEKALSVLANYKERLNIPYEIVYGGYYDKAEATAALGFLDEVISYPTLIFVNADNQITKVHTGFAGPATSQYDDFVSDFDQEVKNLIQ